MICEIEFYLTGAVAGTRAKSDGSMGKSLFYIDADGGILFYLEFGLFLERGFTADWTRGVVTPARASISLLPLLLLYLSPSCCLALITAFCLGSPTLISRSFSYFISRVFLSTLF